MLHFWKKKFAKDENYRTVRDHCYYTSKYRAINIIIKQNSNV